MFKCLCERSEAIWRLSQVDRLETAKRTMRRTPPISPNQSFTD
jgi:hypothetical protein